MSEFVRVTDDVKPRREYTIPRSMFEAFPEQFVEVEGKAATGADGSPLAPKYTPDSLGSESGAPVVDEGFAGMTVEQLKTEIDNRNASRPEAEQISKAGNKAELVAALTAADAEVGVVPPEAPESLSN